MDQSILEAGALEAFRIAFGEPTEPLRERGGALDPRGWCMKFAQAVADVGPGDCLPRLASNREPPEAWSIAVAEAMRAARASGQKEER